MVKRRGRPHANPIKRATNMRPLHTTRRIDFRFSVGMEYERILLSFQVKKRATEQTPLSVSVVSVASTVI
jgi:hypothetical protein